MQLLPEDIAHKLSNHLTALFYYTEKLIIQEQDPVKQKYLKEIIEHHTRIRDLVDKIREEN